jgi:hypothetical protein
MLRDMSRRRILLASTIAVTAALVVFVVLRPREYDAQPESYWRTGDALQIVTLITVGIGDEVIGRNLLEDASTVRVSVRVRENFSNKPALGVRIPVAITLKQALRDRLVQDSTGKVVREVAAPEFRARRSQEQAPPS